MSMSVSFKASKDCSSNKNVSKINICTSIRNNFFFEKSKMSAKSRQNVGMPKIYYRQKVGKMSAKGRQTFGNMPISDDVTKVRAINEFSSKSHLKILPQS